MKEFSERERQIIKIIGRKKMTLEEISRDLFKEIDRFEGNIVVANSVTRIIKKCTFHTLDWTLVKTRENNKLTIKKESL